MLAGHRDRLKALLASPEGRLLSPAMRQMWEFESPIPDWTPEARERLVTRLAFLRTMIKAFDDGGVPILAGTDCPGTVGMFPGVSLHAEIRGLTDAGFSPFAAISAATLTPGQFIAKYVRGAPLFGMVVAGARADLLLVEGNPLDDIAVLRRPTGVLVAGQWIPAMELAERVSAVGATNDAEAAALADQPKDAVGHQQSAPDAAKPAQTPDIPLNLNGIP